MNQIRKGVLGLSLVVALTLSATAGFVVGPSEAEKRAACTDDVMRFCFSKIGNNGRIEACLRAHRPQLSGRCTALFDKYDSPPAQTANSASRSPTTTQAPASDAGPTIAQPANEKPASDKNENPASEKPAMPATTNSMPAMMSGMPSMAKGMLSMAKGMPAMMKNMPAMMPAMMRNMPGM